VKRSVISGVTLLVLVGLLMTGAYVGWQKLKQPLPDSTDDPGQSQVSGPRCKAGVQRGDMVRPRDITVSVYNAGTRSGLAGQTMSELEARGFIAGQVGNAPEDMADVKFVRVLAATNTDPAARLVALQFGPNTLIEAVKEDLGPGVEVIVSDGFLGLVKAPLKIKARAAGSGC
jgi:hypothetical protein